MNQQVEAVYENGVLRPLAPLALAESQRVRITVSVPTANDGTADDGLLSAIREEVAGLHYVPTLDEVRHALAKIPGSLAEDCIAEREDRF